MKIDRRMIFNLNLDYSFLRQNRRRMAITGYHIGFYTVNTKLSDSWELYLRAALAIEVYKRCSFPTDG